MWSLGRPQTSNIALVTPPDLQHPPGEQGSKPLAEKNKQCGLGRASQLTIPSASDQEETEAQTVVSGHGAGTRACSDITEDACIGPSPSGVALWVGPPARVGPGPVPVSHLWFIIPSRQPGQPSLHRKPAQVPSLKLGSGSCGHSCVCWGPTGDAAASLGKLGGDGDSLHGDPA